LNREDSLDGVTLRPLEAFDLAVAAALHAGSFDDAWTEGAIGEMLAMPGSFGTLACLGDQPIGMAIALATGPDAEILTLGVLPNFRRRGVARQLLASVGERAGVAGCERLLLEVAEDNEAAYTLYRGLGFVDIARRPAYYRRAAGAAAAAIVLARPLHRKEGTFPA
jgi:[ribosomal protein S18]-alanine N-acetyltransferase